MAFARRRVDDAAADDVVAETFLVAWRRLDDVPPRPLPWLYGVAHRVLANHYRGVARHDRLEARVSAVAPRAALPCEVDDDVPAAFAGLSPRDREVLALAAWEELDAVEIAVVLGCSPNAAALRLSRARQRFRLALTADGGRRTQRERKRSDA